MPGDITLSTDRIQAVVLSTFRSVCGDTKYQYLSGPVTGGRRFVDWFAEEGLALPDEVFRSAQKAAVVMPNIDALKSFATSERLADRPTIEPGSFEAEFTAWGQPEYYALWDRVIKDHVASVKFLDGWQYSAGCLFEYDSAVRYSVSTYDQQGKPISLTDALRLTDASLADIKSRFLPADDDKSRLRRLHDDIAHYRGYVECRA